jgi:hypothetical protein
MLGSSSSPVLRGIEVSSSHRPQAARRDKTMGSSSRPAAPPHRRGPEDDPFSCDARQDGRSRVVEVCATSG